MGPIAGLGNACCYILWLTVYAFWDWFWPKSEIDIADDFNVNAYKANPEKFGDHEFNVTKPKPQAAPPHTRNGGRFTLETK